MTPFEDRTRVLAQYRIAQSMARMLGPFIGYCNVSRCGYVCIVFSVTSKCLCSAACAQGTSMCADATWRQQQMRDPEIQAFYRGQQQLLHPARYHRYFFLGLPEPKPSSSTGLKLFNW